MWAEVGSRFGQNIGWALRFRPAQALPQASFHIHETPLLQVEALRVELEGSSV